MPKKAKRQPSWWAEIDAQAVAGMLDNDARTDARWREGSRHDVFRQCSIGWHLECSAWGSGDCKCPCHEIAAKAIKDARLAGKVP